MSNKKKRVCFSVDEQTSQDLALFRAMFKDGQGMDDFIARQVQSYIAKIHNKNGVHLEVTTSNELKCAKCDGHMIERNGKHGRFYGCSNHPKCKHTRSISTKKRGN